MTHPSEQEIEEYFKNNPDKYEEATGSFFQEFYDIPGNINWFVDFTWNCAKVVFSFAFWLGLIALVILLYVETQPTII